MENGMEKKIVLLLSSLDISKEQINLLSDLVEQNIDWFKVVRYAINNKVLMIVWHNLTNLKLSLYLPPYLRRMLNQIYLSTKKDNDLFFNEIEKIKMEFSNYGVSISLLKGAYLIPYIYKDYGIRSMNDIDCLVDYEHSEMISEIMTKLGYMNGIIDIDNLKIKPLTRKEEILWKTSMSNLPPFYKLNNEHSLKYIKVDFSTKLDLNTSYDLTKDFLQHNKNSYLDAPFFFLHLCSHLYKEAVNDTYIKLHKDLNLVKFCDIRQFIISMNKNDLLFAIKYAKKNKLYKSVYYTLYYLNELYDDDYSYYMDLLEVDDDSFLKEYNIVGTTSISVWKKPFIERIFSDNNEDEIENMPMFFNNYKLEHAIQKKGGTNGNDQRIFD